MRKKRRGNSLDSVSHAFMIVTEVNLFNRGGSRDRRWRDTASRYGDFLGEGDLFDTQILFSPAI
jgi:hypothetical protein